MDDFVPPEQQDAVWMGLCQGRVDRLWKSAASEYLEGFGALKISLERAPTLSVVNEALSPLTGWQLDAVDDLIPAATFFQMLAERRFPATTRVRRRQENSAAEQPDLFHDVFGHAPMLAEPLVADFVQACGALAIEIGDGEGLDGLIRLFWYTVELGLVREGPSPRVYGATIVSSAAHALHFRQGAEVVSFDLEQVLAAPVALDRFPPKLFVIEDLEDLDGILARFRERALG